MTRPEEPKFDVGQWCDYVRGLVDPTTASTMEAYLRSGVSGAVKAGRMVVALRSVAAVARIDSEVAVPESAVRLAKAAGSLRRPVPGPAHAARFLPFRITFDSFDHPAPSGARDLGPSHLQIVSQRQMIVRAENFRVDIRLDHEATPPSAVVVGQVIELQGEGRPVAEVPVLLFSKDRVVGACLTSRFGEFHAEGLPREPLSLRILVDDEEVIEIPLRRSTDPNQ